MENKETRTINYEVRMTEEGDQRKVYGYAAKYGVESNPMYDWRTGEMFVEVIERGFFDDVMDDPNTRALLNHDQNFVLARNQKTMSITSDEVGLRYEFLAPNTTAGQDLVENLRLGNIDQSSFAFSLKPTESEEWRKVENRIDGVTYVRTLKANGAEKLYDVSPVTYPAYPDATVGFRSLEQYKKQQEPPATTNNLDYYQRKLTLLKLQ